MNPTPRVYAITLNWNRPDDTLACLATLTAQTYARLRMVVVDNGSTDDSVARIQAGFPQAELLINPENLGFARGANLGLRHALERGADRILLVNNDTLLDAQAVERMMAHVQPHVGIIAPLIFYADDPQRIWSAGGKVHPWLLEKSGDRRGQLDDGQWPEPVERDFVTGCGLLVTRRFLETVGFFDERFFMYYEDSDLCLRTKGAGFRILLVPTARMWHKVARSSGGSGSANERYWMGRSSILYFRKHARGVQWLAIGPWRLASALRTTLRLLRTGQREACSAYWRGLRDGLRVG
ncbi:MAG: glycosyltransferase family 2 protein [Anaerolineae bacterium]